VLIPIAQKLKIPISFIGTGETKDDLVQFDAKNFANALVDLD